MLRKLRPLARTREGALSASRDADPACDADTSSSKFRYRRRHHPRLPSWISNMDFQPSKSHHSEGCSQSRETSPSSPQMLSEKMMTLQLILTGYSCQA